jgi:CBS domain-containing protein
MLADCGFALCAGNIMASNPQCCLSQQEWRGRFSEWMIEGDAQALLNATIFFDFRPLYGEAVQARLLGEWLTSSVADNPRFLLQMSANAMRRDAPLGLLRGFVLEKHGEFAGTIDLKLQAATLFVDAARVFALASHSHVSNTADRLRQAVQARLLEADEAEEWITAFYFIEKLRLQSQHASDARGEPMHNHLDPDLLDASERHDLLNALHKARTLQKRLAQTYLGSA